MSKLMLMDAKHPGETRVVIADNETIEDFDFVTSSKEQIKGNIYLAKITRVEPSLQAAFVEYGGNKQGFLPFSEIHPDYYQIPTEDRQRLIEEELEEAQREEEAEEAALEQKSSKRGGRGRRHRRGRGRHRQNETEDESAESSESVEVAEDDEEETIYQAADAEQPEIASEPVSEEEDAAVEAAAEGDEEASEDETETVGADDTEERPRRRGAAFKRYRIQEVIKRNQIVLVQVIKEERGNKGCSLTTYLSLAGRYCVLMPNSPKGGGVSRKISNGEQRRKLKEMLGELKDKRGFPAIIRTAGLDRTKAEIKRDYEYLVKMWTQIREDTLSSNAPSLIYEESDIIKRSIRDMYTGDIEQVLVQGADAYRDCKAFMKMIMPSHAPRVKEYKDEAPIFAVHGVEAQLASMYEQTVKLPSGGYLVIQATEALVSVDVNSGRSTTERNVEETAIKTNLEAAREMARQMRLRDVAGLIVIDFIDMYYGKNRRTLEKSMKDCLKSDRAKIQVSRISPFGLMELSRQRLRPSIVESSTSVCEHCQGTGFVKSLETVAIQIIRLLEREAVSGSYAKLKVNTTAEVAMHLLNDKRHLIQEIEEQNDIEIAVIIDSDSRSGQFQLFKTNDEGKEQLHQEFDDERGRKRKSRGRRGGRGRRRREEEGSALPAKEDDAGDEEEKQAASSEPDGVAEDETKPDKPRRQRKPRRSNNSPKPTNDEEVEASSSDEAEAKPKRSRGRASSRRKAQTAEAEQPSNSHAGQSAEPKLSDDASDGPVEDDPVRSEKPKRTRRRASTRRSSASSSNEAGEQPEETSEALEPSPKPVEPAAALAQPNADVASPKGAAPKRKGWWSRALQGEQSDA